MKLRYLFLFFLFCLLIFCLSSISFAGVDLSTFNKTNIKSCNALIDIVCNNYFGSNFNDIEFTTNIDSYNNIRSEMNSVLSNNYSCWITGYYIYNNNSNNSNGVRFEFCTNKDFNSGTLYRFNLYKLLNGNFIIDKSTFTGRTTNVVGTIPDPSGGRDNRYLWYENESFNGINNFDNVQELFNVTFNPSALATEITYNGGPALVYHINRSVTNWNLGYLSSNFKDTSELHIRLSPLQWLSGDSSISDGTYASSAYYHNGTILNNNKLSLGDNGNVSIPNYYIYYNNIYFMTITYYYDGDNYTRQFPIYFKELGTDSNITNPINPEANTGLDIDFINSLDAYLKNETNASSGDISSLMSNWFKFSGDFYSGDLAFDMGYKYTETRWNNFIYNIYRNIITRIMSPTTNPSITFDLRGRTFTFYANDFTVPNNSLKTFVSVVLTAGFVILFVQQIHLIILNIQTLNLFGTLKSIENKHTFFM